MTSPLPEYRLIPLTQGQQAIVDSTDYEWLSQRSWFALWNKDIQGFYAWTHIRTEDSKRHIAGMHRIILGLEFGDKRRVDHIDQNTLDNRSLNLRIATPAQNGWNQGIRRSNRSGYKGVSWYPKYGKYVAQIRIGGGKRKFLGYRDTAEDAYALYCAAATELHGEFRRTR